MNDLEELKPQEIDFSINSEDELKRLNIVLKRCLEINKGIDEKLDPRIAEANKSHKGLTSLKKETKKPWEDVIEKINKSLKGWYSKKEQESKLLQQKINEDLANKAEIEKQRLLKESEGKDEWSKEIAQEKSKEIIPQTVELKDCKETVLPKQDGQYKRSNWKARIIDELLVPDRFWVIDISKLDFEAKQAKSILCPIAGVEFYDDFTIVTKL